MFSPRDEEEFNWVPLSFIFYIIIQILLCIFIAAIQYTNQENIIEFEMDFSSHPLISGNTRPKTQNVMDYILAYSTMILSIWDSFVSFHRYHTTQKSTLLQDITVLNVIKPFSLYMIIFTSLFVIQMHLFFYIFPLIITMHFAFNIFLSFRFTSIVIRQYASLSKSAENKRLSVSGMEDVILLIKSMYFLFKLALVYVTLQCISLIIVTVSFDTNTMYFLPIFWCLSTSVYSLNFIRNKRYFANMKCCKRAKKTKAKVASVSPSMQSSQPHLRPTKSVDLHTSTPTENELLNALGLKPFKSADDAHSEKLRTESIASLKSSGRTSEVKLKESIDLSQDKIIKKPPLKLVHSVSDPRDSKIDLGEFKRAGRLISCSETLRAYGICTQKDITELQKYERAQTLR